LDTEVKAAFVAARQWFERQYGRTITTARVRRMTWSTWPDGPIWIDYPPLIAVDTIKYYAATTNVLTTLSSSNYAALASTDTRARIEWSATSVLPSHYERPDAIQVNYQTGYATQALIPEVAKQAIRVLAGAWFLEDDGDRIEKAQNAAMCVMSAMDSAGYR
jgi:hypothetical protein